MSPKQIAAQLVTLRPVELDGAGVIESRVFVGGVAAGRAFAPGEELSAAWALRQARESLTYALAQILTPAPPPPEPKPSPAPPPSGVPGYDWLEYDDQVVS